MRRARFGSLSALSSAPQRLALILSLIAAALLASFAAVGTSVAATPNGVTPTITAISPTSGPATGGTTVIISGSGFTGVTTVLFGTTPAASFTVTSGTSISAVSPAGGGTVDIRVEKFGTESATSSADQYTYTSSTPAPTVTGVSPTSGPQGGGNSIVLTGTNFVGVAGVSFGGVAATTFTANSSTQITVTAPAYSSTGSVNVQVTAQGGVSATNGNAVYTYANASPPTVSGVSPTSGPASGGTSVTITGTNFTGATSVKFGSASASFTVNSATSITALSPVASAGTVDITVTTSAGTSTTGATDQFTYSASPPPAPAVTAINPTSGPTSGGTSVTITGANFTGATSVKFGAASASFTLNSATSITAASPAGSAGTVDVTVTTSGGTSATGAADQFTYTGSGGGPSITQISPTGGVTTGGTSVVITGSGFTGATAVKFGTKAATSFTVNSDSQVTTVSPSGTGAVDITITTPSGTSATVAADKFTYGAVPAVTRINPTSGPSTGGTSITITGSAFTGATSVSFGGVAAQSFSVTNATTISAVSPPGSGTVDVQVTTPVGTSVARTLDHFTYTGAAPAPTVTAVSPTSGSTAGGTSVTITGANFTGATSVKFGTATASFTVNSATSITATSPAGSAGTVDIAVTTSAGTSATTSADQFTYTAGGGAPTVTGVSPNSGPTGGGTGVTITGTNFTGADSVLFGNAGVAFTIVNATTITASSPGGTGTVDVTVESPAGNSATNAADRFTYVAPTQAPVITSVVPNAGPASGGNQVTINGSNFSGAMGVKFGTVSTSGFSIVSDTQMTVFAPAGQMGTVDVTVTTAVGTSATGSADLYTYNTAAAPPQITSVSPSSGATGTTVSIMGSGFTGATSVSFGGVLTSFTIEADGAMQAAAPTPALNATTVDITVTTPAGTSVSTSSDHFTYTNTAPQPTISHVSPATGLTTGGASVVITGTNFNDVTQVRFGINNAIFTVNSATQITATAPANSAGTVDIVVVAQGGANATSAADEFTYLSTLTPVIQQVTPPGGPVSGGTVVDILGTGFTGATSVSFGSAAGTNLSVISDTEVQATSPAGSGVVDVKVTGPSGSSAAVAGDQFTYAAVPTVSGVSPTGGPAAGGTSVTITGTNFAGASGVEFGTTPATFTVNSATSITASAPLGTGTVDVRVITPAGVSATASSDQYAYAGSEPPVVTSLSPTAAGGPTGGGTSIAINGVNFLGATSVKFGTVAAASFTVNNDGLIIAVSPATAQAGPVDVTVTTASGASATSSADIFTYVTGNAAPTLTGLSPSSGAVGASVTITGTNFSGVQQVSFGPIPATSFTVNSPTSITATVPAGQGGIVDVVVTAASGFTVTSPADRFTYTGTGPQPTITGVSPSQGDGNGGYPITITGTNLSGAQVVYFGSGGQSGQITSNTSTSLTVTAISDVAGTVDLQVATANGVSAINASDKFTFTQTLPKVTGVSPNSGPIEGLNTVTITGTGFTKAQAVFFGTSQANTFSVKSDTTITAAPVSGNGPVDVVVETADGFSAANPSDVYTFTPGPSDPTISSISPDYGPETSPPPVTVTGTNFVNVQKVLWDGVTPAGFTVNSATSITLSPVGGQPGVHQIQIITATGKTPPFSFTVLPTPTVNGLSPSNGPTTGGGTVVINGSGFTGATVVRFGSISVPFTVNSDFAVTATVPAVNNPALVDVTVSNPAQTSAFTYLDQYNYTTASTPTVSVVTPNNGPMIGGTPVTVIGSHFTGATSVLFGNEAATNVKVVSDTELTAVSPSGSIFSQVDVRVVGPGGESVPSQGDTFSYSNTSLQPEITAVSPNSGAPTGGTSVTITGLNFTDANAVKFGQNPATSFTVNSATSITAVSPSGNPGVVDISVTTAAGISATGVSDAFTYASGTPAPVVVSVNPNNGPAAGGTVVAIQGDNFSGVTAVKFGGVAATSFTVNNVNLITAVAPAGSSGIVDIQVVTGGGTSAANTNDQFTYAPSTSSPTVTSINPTHGPAAGGTSVVITGTNLTGATAVHFGTQLAASFTVNSDTQVTAVSPPANAALADISVTTPAGTSAVQGQSTFAYDTGTTPIIFSVAPTSGPTGGGAQVTINGANFTGVTQVLFGSVASVGAIGQTTNSQLIVTSPAEAAGVVDIKVIASAGTTTTGPSDQYTFVAIPTITAISPATGSTAGGTKVVITGSAFTGATAVKFGATSAATFTVNSDSQITVTSPAGSAGVVDISVTAPAGVSAFVTADRFTYAASAPAITSVAPNSGTTAGGTSVVISGSFFSGATAVKFGTVAAASFTVNSDNQITAISPAGAVASVDITVTTPNGASATSFSDQFTYSADPIPAVTAVSPTSGPTSGGNTVSITGTGFVNVKTVKFGANGWLGGSINANGTVITASVPPGSSGTVDITVVNDAGVSPVNASDKYTYSANPAPVVTAVSPTGGSTTGGTSVTITGSGFTGATAVKFGATAATAFTVNSDTQVTATSPAGSAGTVDVTVTTANGTSATGSADQFTYAAATTPTVTAINPSSGATTGGTSVVITGTNFTGATAVKFGATAAASFTVNSVTQITATSPPGVAGTVDITVVNGGGTSAVNTADHYTYTGTSSGPTVTGVTPTSGPTTGGNTVTISGSGFTGASVVHFGNTPAGFVVVSDTQISATAPAGAVGIVDVTVTTAAGTSLTSSADNYSYLAGASPPVVTSLSPTGGPVTGGTTVTISGAGFTGATAVKFGTKAATSFTVVNDGQMTAVSPAGSAGAVDVTVTNAAGTSATVAADKFTYGATPAVTRINPSSGPSTGGTTVTVTGSGFTGATAVTFGGVAAQSFSVTNATTISAVSPSGSGTVDVQVTTPVGTSIARTLDHFIYTGAAPAPSVTAISPTSGPTTGGTSVSITGTNFTGATSVKFGTVSASFTVNSAGSITATSPAGSAGTVDVTVTTAAGTSTLSAADQFTYNAGNTPPTVTGVSPNNGYFVGGYNVAITGSNFTGVQEVLFGNQQATFTVNSSGSITAVAPGTQTLGAVDVTVVTSAGTSAITSADQFTYTNTPPVPVVTGVSPTQGPSTGGTQVTITGSGFTSTSRVSFGSSGAGGYGAITFNSMVVSTGPSAAGTVDVTVTNSTGTSAPNANDKFTFTGGAPVITSVTPGSGPIDGGTTVVLGGVGFTGATSVTFGSTPATSFVVNSDGQITTVSPPGTTGRTTITVTTPLGSGGNSFTYTDLPTISGVSPNSGSTGGGNSVTITGEHFTGASVVQFGQNHSVFTVNSDTSITATVPESVAGTVDIFVTTQQGANVQSTSDKYTYIAATPTVTGVSPSSGVLAGGNAVTITGTNFNGATNVLFGSVSAKYVINSPTNITATVPSSSTTGAVDVTVMTPSGTSAQGASDRYTYTAEGAPTVTAISPISGFENIGNAPVQITGTNFTGATAVMFGTLKASSFQVLNDTTISAGSAILSAGSYDVTVVTPSGVSATSSADVYTALPQSDAPAVTALSPQSGTPSGGTTVFITGANFTNVIGVKFGATAATSFTINGATSISAVSPAGSGTVDVTVITANGTSAVVAADQFSYVAPPPPPTVTSLSPSFGPPAGGTSVTISGTQLSTVGTVKFGTVSVGFGYSNGQIFVQSPAGTGTVDITVSNANGTSATSTADQFTYGNGPPPVVSGVSPAGGSPSGGSSVKISGVNFTGATAVKFGGVSAQSFSVANDNTINAVTPSGSGVVDVTVTTAGGTSATSPSDTYDFVAPPTITGFNPSHGPIAGGTSVTISGTNFTGASTVMFGQIPATSFTVNNDTTITAVAPAVTSPQSVNVTVAAPGGSFTTTSIYYTYTSATLAVTSVSPNQGPSGCCQQVTIAGSGFTGASAVNFGTAQATITSFSDTQLVVSTPSGSPGTVDVTVTSPLGVSPTSSADKYTFVAAPTLTSISPTSGPAAGGTSVVITGAHFTGATAVAFGQSPAASFVINSDTQITAVSPSGSGTVNIQVTTPGGFVSGAQSAFTYSGTPPAPTVTAVSPASGPPAGGNFVTITGNNFITATAVKFGSSPATFVTVVNSTTMQAGVPGALAGTVDVTVTSPSGTSAVSSGDKYTYVATPPPTVTGLNPASGSTAGGTSVVVTGSGFTGATAVKFGGTAATSFTVNSDTQVTAISPETINGAGAVDVTVTTPNGASEPTAADQFTYLLQFAPQLNGSTPPSGPLAGGTTVTVTGSNFTGATAVAFGGKAATSFVVHSDSQITAVTPAGTSPGPVAISVTSPNGTNSPNSTGPFFTFLPSGPPAITAIAPSAGAADGGTGVLISGSNFTGATGVTFGGVAANFVIAGDGQITAESPAGSGTVDIVVTGPSGSSATVAADKFSYGAAPSVSGVSPPTGSTAGGATVTITGANFTGVTSVSFGLQPATSWSVTNPTTITAVAPAGNGVVDVTVASAFGASVISAADHYAYGAPTVGNVSPNSGVTTGGTQVGIQGVGLTGATAVKFGATAATSFTVSSDNLIIAFAPAGSAGTVDITVTTPAGTTATSSADKYTYFVGPTVTGVSPTSGPAAGSTSVTITGTGFTNAQAVWFGPNIAEGFSVKSDTQIVVPSPPGTGIVDVQVVASSVFTPVSTADRFSYTGGAPKVTGVSPASGSTAGGTSVTIKGAAFTGATGVKFGAVSATSFTVNSDGQITATSPAGSTGLVDITVTTANGVSATGAADQYAYVAPPSVSTVSPNSGPAAGGTGVTITGANLDGVTAVKFGSTPATSFVVMSNSEVSATAPAGTVGAVDVTVVTAAGTSATVAADKYTYTGAGGAPAVTAINPTNGPTSGGTSVTVSGSGFTGATAVKFGASAATAFTVNSDSQITATSPAGSVGVVDITVTTSGGTSATVAADQFTYSSGATLPTVTTVAPNSGPTAGGTSVVITGTNLTGATSVKFGSTPATTFTANSATQITVSSPVAGSGGTVDVTVTTSSGTSATSTADHFTYIAAPTVTAVSPTGGPIAGGTSVVITGTNLTGATAVKFGATAATAFTVNSATQITATAPAGSAGSVDVTVTTLAGTSTMSAADQYLYAAAPTVTAVSPTSGPIQGGTPVVITGTNFTGATSVKFGATVATAVVESATQINATSPAGSGGTIDITVTTPAGTSATGTSDHFTYIPAPTVTAIAPSSGPTAGGTSVVITGTNFTGSSAVRFGTTGATFAINSATQITATSPAGSAGVVDITVSTVSGTSATGTPDQFTYSNGSGGAPVVTKVAPAGGVPAGGTSVVITGSGFTAATAVKFGTKAATSFAVNSDTQVTAVSPSGTGTVDITVATANGTSATGAADQFVYQASPTVSIVSPSSGPAGGGTSVTITGTAFTGATQVTFGATPATSFTVVNATKITAVSPAGSGTVDILVTTSTGTSGARITDHFTYTGSAVKAQATLRIHTGFGAAVTVDLTRGRQASGGKVTLLTPSSAGAARVVADATTGAASLQFTPAQGFSGKVVVSYALNIASADAADAVGDVEITVDTRPDPSADPGVRGVIQAETDASLRFADAQISNFNQHLESLHSDGRGKGGNGVSFNFGFGQDQPNLFAQREVDANRIVGDQAWPTPALPADPSAKQPAPSKYPARAAAGPGLGSGSGDSPLTVWTGGAITFGQTDAMTLRPGFRFTSDGLSAGVDAHVSDQLTLGAGAGVGQSYAQVDGGSRVDGHDFVGVLYGDWRPVKSAYVDVIAGWGRLDFASHRIVSPGVTALGDRSGEDPFVSMTAGWIIARDGGFKLTPYTRLDEISGRLDAFTEHGAGTSDLRFDEQSFNSLQGTLGLRGEWRVPTGYGDWAPRFRFEAHHEFDGTGLAGVNYADDLAGPPFTTQADPMRSDSLSAGVGADLHFENKTLNLDYTATSDFVRQTVHELSAKLAFKFW